MITERYEYKPINRVNVDGKRYYATPTGNKLPSVTTILDRTKPEEQKQALRNWKKRVGEKKAQEIVTEAASRGTRMHAYLERFVKEDDLGEFPSNPYAQTAWFMAAQVVLKGMDSEMNTGVVKYQFTMMDCMQAQLIVLACGMVDQL